MKPRSTSAKAGSPPKPPKRKLIVQRAQAFDPKTGRWKAATTGSTKMRGKMRRMIKVPKAQYLEPDNGKRIQTKRIISAKTNATIKKPGTKRKVRFEYVYEDGTKYTSKPVKPSKAELALFKGTKAGDAHAHLDGETEGSNADQVELFTNCIDVPRGGPISTAREAIAKVLGSFQLPKEGKFEILIYWKIYEDKLKENVLDAPPSKRFTVDAEQMRLGYGQFMQSMMDLKKLDLENEWGVDFEEILDDYPERVKKWKADLIKKGEVPKNTTRAFIEKQFLTMAQGRGVYISDKSYFKDHYKQKAERRRKGKKSKRTEPTQLPETAEHSEICVKVWALPEPKKRGKKA